LSNSLHAGEPPGRSSIRERKLQRLLAINKKINSSLEVDTVLSWTIDSGLELTGAERGFVLLRDEASDDGLKVAVARNIHQSSQADDLQLSRGIAQAVIDDAEPVTAVDAQGDERFANSRSVHAIALKSVACVPIRAPEGVLGALYLDHRFERGVFDQADLELLVAFADQVAIALTNARLHQKLAERTEQLNRVLAGQEEKIDRLTLDVRHKQAALERRYDYTKIIGDSVAMQQVFAVLDRVIDADVPILIHGESGTGKEMVARAIHYNGARKNGPMVAVNCGALPESLLESELFGHMRGAFTGADRDRVGLFVAARGGTVFLDEIGETPLAMQVKLLRVLQEQELTPLGATAPVKIDVRVVSASNRRLYDEVAAGRFREDLFYRVAVVEVEIPPLREREADIPILAKHLIGRIQGLEGATPNIAPAAMRVLLKHSWPGNVRELDNVLTTAALLCKGNTIRPSDLRMLATPTRRAATRSDFKREEGTRIREVLQANNWNISAAARLLGLSRTTLYRKIKQYEL